MVTAGGADAPARWRPLVALLWIVLVSGAGLTFATLEGGDAWRPAAADPSSVTSNLVAQGPQVDAANASGAPASSAAGVPLQLKIPRLGIDAAIEAVATDPDGRMSTPVQPQHVGWYRLGVRPGDPGDAVIDGHVDWPSGPAAFQNLQSVAAGDEIVAVTSSNRLTFKVDRTTKYSFRATVPGLFTQQGAPQLSLITCTGGWDPYRRIYLQRLVVHAVLVSKVANL